MELGLLFIILVVLAIVSLATVSVVNHRQKRKRSIALRIQALRRRILELDETALAIEPLLENLTGPRVVYQEVVGLADAIVHLDPTVTSIEPIRESARAAANRLANGERTRDLNRALSSDTAIARHQHHLRELCKVTRKRASSGQIKNFEMEEILNESKWAMLMVVVISNIGQGHLSMQQGNLLKASGFYRHARDLLSTNDVADPRRDQLLSELSEIIAGKRRCLSPSIMPETHLNPPETPPPAKQPAAKSSVPEAQPLDQQTGS